MADFRQLATKVMPLSSPELHCDSSLKLCMTASRFVIQTVSPAVHCLY